MPNTEETKNFDSATSKVESGMSITTIILFCMTLVFSKAATKLVGAIMSLQIVIHLALFNLSMPANCSNFIQKMKPLVGFNLVKVLAKWIKVLIPNDDFIQVQIDH